MRRAASRVSFLMCPFCVRAQDKPRTREKALTQRVLRSTDDPNEVFIYLEYETLADATEARDRLVSSGLLNRFDAPVRWLESLAAKD